LARLRRSGDQGNEEDYALATSASDNGGRAAGGVKLRLAQTYPTRPITMNPPYCRENSCNRGISVPGADAVTIAGSDYPETIALIVRIGDHFSKRFDIKGRE
jgi:hypothetical protein